jgi:hypothetical protein
MVALYLHSPHTFPWHVQLDLTFTPIMFLSKVACLGFIHDISFMFADFYFDIINCDEFGKA